ncbi:flagellar hook-length control protein FliK [Paraburkholderia sp. DHOC27]|uniref:flagellar hook-length control protein FliK n=1 Tax=Paraburkholderia sp. DHOC27 TaxID=2303330 RepID=UPI000E3D58BF|nr:flagellar hook-length control protein FliK [Paraburkholderia sp. DHOC27]RFU43698.1 flagellar hook-length control protein FliK [Paraburkholderia sp. DHOC27]
MNGIDTAIASLLASRVDSLLNIAPGATSTAQAGASTVGVDTPATPDISGNTEPPASAQTALSAIALTLNAIVLSGGEATPAVVGQAPIWPAAPALDVEITELPLFESLSGQADAAALFSAGAGSASGLGGANTAAAQAASASADPAGAANVTAANVAASPVPVAALAAALEQTVAGSGLFYEAHLAQWLAGQLTPADLASEPQNRLADGATQLPLNWAADAEVVQPGNGSATSSTAASQQPGRAGTAQSGATADSANARVMPSIQTPQAARFAASEMLADSLTELSSQPDRAALHAASVGLGDTPTQATQSVAAAIDAATVPLVRQQLDMLATGQFRWTGEAWPGAKLDWTIQQDGDEWQRSGGGAASEQDYPWRTRLTLSLPLLGTVDAELTLTGTRLAARVLASPLGAARLSGQSEGFRQRLAAAGIELSGLSIREIGGGSPGSAFNAAAAAAAQAAAASAYARSAPATEVLPAERRSARGERTTRAQRPLQKADNDFDWDL